MTIAEISSKRKTLSYRILSSFIVFFFTLSLVLPPSYAQSVFTLPAPGTMVTTSPGFTPTLINGIIIHPDNPLKFDFIIGSGDQRLEGQAFEDESTRLIKYFLASLTVPEDEMWVNLSPYEKDRIIPQGFGTTEMGRDLLAQDYILKQLTASLMYPEKELGSAFWKKIYQKAYEQYGTTEIPVNTFNKVWIVPDKAVVYEHENSAFVVKSHLKVMLEEDYLASGQRSVVSDQKKDLNTEHLALGTEIIREVILPELEKEVNEGQTFANLRQIYNAVILAAWFKKNLKATLLGQVYVDKGKTKGIDLEDKTVNQKIYEQYLEAFKKGVYNYIKEDYDPATKEIIPRKYFSGGITTVAVGSILEENQRIDAYVARQMGWAQGRKVEVDMLELSEKTSVAAAQEAIEAAKIKTSSPVTYGLLTPYSEAEIKSRAKALFHNEFDGMEISDAKLLQGIEAAYMGYLESEEYFVGGGRITEVVFELSQVNGRILAKPFLNERTIARKLVAWKLAAQRNLSFQAVRWIERYLEGEDISSVTAGMRRWQERHDRIPPVQEIEVILDEAARRFRNAGYARKSGDVPAFAGGSDVSSPVAEIIKQRRSDALTKVWNGGNWKFRIQELARDAIVKEENPGVTDKAALEQLKAELIKREASDKDLVNRINNKRLEIARTEALAFRKQFENPPKEFKDLKISILSDNLELPVIAEVLKGSILEVGVQSTYFDPNGDLQAQINQAYREGARIVQSGHSMHRMLREENAEVLRRGIKPITNEELAKINRAIIKDGRLTLWLAIEESTSQDAEQQIKEGIEIGLNGIDRELIPTVIITPEPSLLISTKGGDKIAEPGLKVSPEDADNRSKRARSYLSKRFGEVIASQVSIGYGASVGPDNGEAIFAVPSVRNSLIGGKSWTPLDFYNTNLAVARGMQASRHQSDSISIVDSDYRTDYEFNPDDQNGTTKITKTTKDSPRRVISYSQMQGNLIPGIRAQEAEKQLAASSPVTAFVDALQASYKQKVTDEYVKPVVLVDANGNPVGLVKNGDAWISLNFRRDRTTQLTEALLAGQNFKPFHANDLNLMVVEMKEDENGLIPPDQMVLTPVYIPQTVGEYFASLGLKQFRTSETEKFRHLTRFFNGAYSTVPFAGEDRLLVDSPRDVATYDQKPEMSAYAVTDGLVEKLNANEHDFYFVNYANPDMVGHTGNLEATIQAIRHVDINLKRVLEAAQAQDINVLITADHGNADEMIDEKGKPQTKHSKNPVPFIFVPAQNVKQVGIAALLSGGGLADIAPTLLYIMGRQQPVEMTGRNLLQGYSFNKGQKTLLIVLDGFGINPNRKDPGDAIRLASEQRLTPTLDQLFREYPNTTLEASGEAVGLPPGQMGSSETGHMSMGAGRVIKDQPLVKINEMIAKDQNDPESFFQNPALLKAMRYARDNHKALHVETLLSDGGVHSMNTHLYALLEMAKAEGVSEVYIHPVLDGRDVGPQTAKKYLEELQQKIDEIGIGQIATMMGRFYAMDRDYKWDRTKIAYDAYVRGEGEHVSVASSPMVEDQSIRQWSMNGQSAEQILNKVVQGYDIRGYDGYGDPKKYPKQFDETLLRWIGRGTASTEFYSEVHERTVSLNPGDLFIVGGDNGPSTEWVKENFEAGLQDAGVNVIDLGALVSGELYTAIRTLGAQGGGYVTRSHVEVGTNGLKEVIGGITLYGDMLQGKKKQILTAKYRKADHAGVLNDVSKVKTLSIKNVEELRKKVRTLYLDSLRKEFSGLKALLDQFPVKIAVNLNGGAAAQPEYKAFLQEMLGEHLVKIFREESDPWNKNGGLADPTRADNTALSHPKANIIEYSKANPDVIIINFDLDVDRVGSVWNGELYLGDRMFYPVIEYMLTIDKYKNINQRIPFLVDSRMLLEVGQMIKHFGGIAQDYAKGHSRIKAEMDAILKKLAAEEGYPDIQSFLAAHPGFKIAQSEYSIHEFLTNQHGEAFDDAFRFGFFWLEVFVKVRQKYGKPNWTLADYIKNLVDQEAITLSKQLKEQRVPVTTETKKPIMLKMRDHVLEYFQGRNDFNFRSGKEYRKPKIIVEPYRLNDIEGVFDFKTPVGQVFWGWSETSPKDAYGVQSDSTKKTKNLTEAVLALFILSRKEIAPDLAPIDPLETKQTMDMFDVTGIEQRTFEEFGMFTADLLNNEHIDPGLLSMRIKNDGSMREMAGKLGIDLSAFKDKEEAVSAVKKIFFRQMSEELEQKILAIHPTVKSALMVLASSPIEEETLDNGEDSRRDPGVASNEPPYEDELINLKERTSNWLVNISRISEPGVRGRVEVIDRDGKPRVDTFPMYEYKLSRGVNEYGRMRFFIENGVVYLSENDLSVSEKYTSQGIGFTAFNWLNHLALQNGQVIHWRTRSHVELKMAQEGLANIEVGGIGVPFVRLANPEASILDDPTVQRLLAEGKHVEVRGDPRPPLRIIQPGAEMTGKISDLKNVAGKSVFMRVDHNGMFDKTGKIVSTQRINANTPTVTSLREMGVRRIVMATHAEKPGGKVVPAMSPRPVAEYLKKVFPQWNVIFMERKVEESPEDYLERVNEFIDREDPEGIIYLDNLRFDPREQSKDPQERLAMAQQLKALADLYVNDAFSVSHRADTSVYELDYQFAPEQRAGGISFQQEMGKLYKFENELRTLKMPKEALAVIAGSKLGGKEGKLQLLKGLSRLVKKLRVEGMLAIPFLALEAQTASRYDVDAHIQKVRARFESLKNSGADAKAIKEFEKYVQVIEDRKDEMKEVEKLTEFFIRHRALGYTPPSIVSDFVAVPEDNQNQAPVVIKREEFLSGAKKLEEWVIIDTGPEELNTLKREARESALVFWNGSLGFTNMPEEKPNAQYAKRVTWGFAQYLATLRDKVKVALGGGNTIADAQSAGLTLEDVFFLVLLGGGASQEFLIQTPLPGIQPLLRIPFESPYNPYVTAVASSPIGKEPGIPGTDEDRDMINNSQTPGLTPPETIKSEGGGTVIDRPYDEIIDDAYVPGSSPVTEGQAAPGGIDLNPALLDLQIKRDANFVPLPLPQQPLREMRIEGFIPVIINITPVTNLPLLLGLVDTKRNTDDAAKPDLKARDVEEISALN